MRPKPISEILPSEASRLFLEYVERVRPAAETVSSQLFGSRERECVEFAAWILPAMCSRGLLSGEDAEEVCRCVTVAFAEFLARLRELGLLEKARVRLAMRKIKALAKEMERRWRERG